MPFDAQKAISSANSSFFSDIGAWFNKNPLLGGLAIGAGTSLLTSLISGFSSGGSSNTGGSTATTGFCTTQYFYTSDTSQLSNPCAIYNPSGGTNSTGNTTDNGVSGLLNNINSSNSPTISIPTTSISGLLNTPGSIVSSTAPIATVETPTNTVAPETTITTTDTGAQAPISVSDLLSNGQYYSNTTSNSTPSASQTPLNQASVPAPVNGLHGDLLSFGGGATIYASSRTESTEVAGFYGSNAAPGALCQSRPWSSGFLSYIIPPSFFDQICSWAGYPVGVVQTSAPGGVGGALYGGSASNRNVSVPAPRSGTPYTAPVQASAKIWARPASVSLGGRTTIFWTSQNTTSCTESSSDGNFSGNSTSGGASTVALSGAVTFTIRCNTLDGKTISDSTTVNIGI